jgi:hypothetical protein
MALMTRKNLSGISSSAFAETLPTKLQRLRRKLGVWICPGGVLSEAQKELEHEIEEECKSEFRNHLAEDALAWLGRIEKSVRTD